MFKVAIVNNIFAKCSILNVWQVLNTPLNTLHKKWSFPLRISSVNVTKSIGNSVQWYTYLVTILEMTGDHFENITTNLSFAQPAFNQILRKCNDENMILIFLTTQWYFNFNHLLNLKLPRDCKENNDVPPSSSSAAWRTSSNDKIISTMRESTSCSECDMLKVRNVDICW